MARELETVNAKIKSTMFGIEDHGCMTFFVFLEWLGASQGLGGYAIDQYRGDNCDRTGQGAALVAIRKILEVVGVDTWEALPGKLVRLQVEGLGSSRTPIIGHIIEDRWFDLQKFMKEAT